MILVEQGLGKHFWKGADKIISTFTRQSLLQILYHLAQKQPDDKQRSLILS
jgi:hypothetical protein